MKPYRETVDENGNATESKGSVVSGLSTHSYTISKEEAMGLSRKQRRELAKLNGVKNIPGSNRPIVKEKVYDQYKN